MQLTEPVEFSGPLAMVVRRAIAGARGIDRLRRLSGGASQETWAFEALCEGHPVPLILRRAPGGDRQSEQAVGLEAEAALMRLAKVAGVPEPQVHYVLQPSDSLGRGFIAEFIEGETLGGKIVRDERLAEARKTLAFECGGALARIHRISLDHLPTLRSLDPSERFEELFRRYKQDGVSRPVFSLAFEWLRDRIPLGKPLTLVHGDFRNGNLIVAETGLRAVLDWELAHIGDPVEDLGWICVNSWRFSEIDKPVGGFGRREDLLRGYEAGGGAPVNLEDLTYWEAFGSLNWGMMCSSMASVFRGGIDRSAERAMIARRTSETELDLLNLVLPRG